MLCEELVGDESHQINLNQHVLGQARDFDGGAGRGRGARGGKMLGVDGVHGGEVVEVLEEDGGFDDLGEAAAGGFENGFEVGEDLRGLLSDARVQIRDAIGGLPVDARITRPAMLVRVTNINRLQGFGRNPAPGSSDPPVIHAPIDSAARDPSPGISAPHDRGPRERRN